MAIPNEARHAWRSLSLAPRFAAAVIVPLTLGLGAAIVVFGLVDAAIRRPPPFAEPDRLMVLNITQQTPAAGQVRQRWSWRRFQLLQPSARAFEHVASHSNAVVTITGVADPEPLPIEIVSPSYFATLRAPIASGRGLDEDRADGRPAIVLGHDLWQRRFASARDAIGRSISLNGSAFTIVGVAAPGFTGISGLAQAWIPATAAPTTTYDEYLTTNQNFISAIGRLRPGVSVPAARAELAAVGERIHAVMPSEADTPDDRFSATLVPLNEARADAVTRRALTLLAAAALVLLLIACANAAGLLLERGVTRRREIAIRLAIGGSRRRIAGQLLLESVMLAVAASACGLLIAWWVLDIVEIPATLARGRNFYGAIGEFAAPGVDWRLLAFVPLLAVATVLTFGLVPALRATRPDLTDDLKRAAGSIGDGRGWGLRDAVVAGQIGLSIVLMVVCGLLLSSYARLRATPLGFEPQGLLTFMIRPSEVRYPPATAPLLIDRILDEVARVPGVEAATVDGCAPLTVQCARAALHIVGRPWPQGREAPIVSRHYVAPAHFRTLRTALLQGRTLADSDREGRPRVVVITESAARRFWPNGNALGQRVWFDGAAAFGTPERSAEIVGIVQDAAYVPLDEQPMQPGFFTPYAQFTYATRMVLVRAANDPRALLPQVASAVRRADPDLALFDVLTMEERARRSWAKQTSQTAVLGIIATIAVALAATGIYAVTAFAVASRRREIGLRMALGATRGQVIRHAVAGTARTGAVGAVSGLVLAFAVSRVLGATLYETAPLDPRVYGLSVALLVAVFMLASWVPVRRAIEVNPADTLRSE